MHSRRHVPLERLLQFVSFSLVRLGKALRAHIACVTRRLLQKAIRALRTEEFRVKSRAVGHHKVEHKDTCK